MPTPKKPRKPPRRKPAKPRKPSVKVGDVVHYRGNLRGLEGRRGRVLGREDYARQRPAPFRVMFGPKGGRAPAVGTMESVRVIPGRELVPTPASQRKRDKGGRFKKRR